VRQDKQGKLTSALVVDGSRLTRNGKPLVDLKGKVHHAEFPGGTWTSAGAAVQ
jgi:hypothetical protein